MSTHKIFSLCILLICIGTTSCKKKTDFGLREWPGTTVPCDNDDDCVKVVDFHSGCGSSGGYLVAIHRAESELYRRMFWEYQQKRTTINTLLRSTHKTCGKMVMARCRDRRCTLVDEKAKPPTGEWNAPPEYRKTMQEMRACVRDDECVKVRAEKCKDRYEAVNRKFERIFRDVRYRDIFPIDCPRITPDLTSEPEVIPVCRQGQCQLTGGDDKKLTSRRPPTDRGSRPRCS